MIELKNISVKLSPDVTILTDISTYFQRAKLHAIVGPNGSGKTTLLKVMAGLLPHSQNGHILADGKNLQHVSIEDRAKYLAYVESQHTTSFSYLVRDIISWGRWIHHHGKPSDGDNQIIISAAEATGTKHLLDRPMTHLSTGERKKIMLAQSLASQAQFLLWDEPLAPLDLKSAATIVKLMKGLTSAGHTILASFHDVPLALRSADTITIIFDGKLAWTGDTSDPAALPAVEDVFRVKTLKDGLYFT